MAGTVNKVILIGRLGKDPEMKSIPSGTQVAKFSLATDERYQDKNGEWQDRTEWHNIVAWGKLAERCGNYLRKGKLVFIEGTIRTDSWDDKESGQKKYRTEIIAREMHMLGPKGEDDGGSSSYSSARRPAASAGSVNDGPPEDDDVPF